MQSDGLGSSHGQKTDETQESPDRWDTPKVPWDLLSGRTARPGKDSRRRISHVGDRLEGNSKPRGASEQREPSTRHESLVLSTRCPSKTVRGTYDFLLITESLTNHFLFPRPLPSFQESTFCGRPGTPPTGT